MDQQLEEPVMRARESSDAGRIRVVCIAVGEALRGALERRLGREPDMVWVGGAADASEIRGLIAALEPQVLLLDLSSARCSRLDALASVYAEMCGVKGRPPVTIVLAAEVTPALECAARQAGVTAVLRKNDGMERIVEAIRSYG